jgi:putative ABC transport system permease protein
MMTHMMILMAFRAIRHHAFRSLLTLLGIVIGIAGIIAIVAVGKGAQKKARDQFLAYGSKSIDLSPGNFLARSKKPPKRLTLDDINAIYAQCPSIQYVSPVIYRQGNAEYEGDTKSVHFIGGSENTLQISERTLQSGVYFSRTDIERKENVVVLSHTTAESFFKLQDPRGAVIRINKIPFTVIGVLAPPKLKGKWDNLGFLDIFAPFSTVQKYFGDYVNDLEMCTYTDAQVPEAIRQLEKVFRAAHHLEEGESNDFVIRDTQTFAAAAEEASKSVGLFSIIAALIALIVGGIGVMNIMLVAVKERTKEIGIKSALGATRNIIRTQFLLEAIAICMLGGLVGVVSGVTVSMVLDRFFHITAIVEPMPVLAAFLFTALIGLVFGFYPAESAARMRPVEALAEY